MEKNNMELLDEALKLTCDLLATVSLLDLVQRGIADKAPEMMEVADALRQIGEHLDNKTSKLIDLIDEAQSTERRTIADTLQNG